MPVLFGSLSDWTGSSDEVSSVLYFLYETHQEFQLECNPTETLLFPRDELLLFRLVLRQIELSVEYCHTDLLDSWIKVCRHRILGSRETSDLIKQLSDQVEQHLKINNLADRVSISRRVIEEFDANVELRTLLLTTSYVVPSPDLDWFEHIMLGILIEAGAPNIEFRFDIFGENKISVWKLCNSKSIRRYKRCVVSDVLLSYLGLAVNMKDIIRLRLVMDNPPRGLGDAVFTTLHRLSRVENVSAFQVASSFVRRQSLQGLTCAQTNLHPLASWSPGLTDLVNSVVRCQDALSGSLEEDTLLTLGSADGRMSVEEACNSVVSSLRQVGRIFNKPAGRTFMSSSGDDDSSCLSTQITPGAVQRALKRLYERTFQLAASQSTELLCCETPDRPLCAGGSMYGRAALKLVRLLLVTEADRVAPEQHATESKVRHTTDSQAGVSANHVTATQSPQPAATPPRPALVPADCTPTTDGRGSRLLPMFASPLLGNLVRSPSVVGSADLMALAELGQQSAQLEALKEPIKIPTCPVFSRYQSNLDWTGSGEQFTPPCRRHLAVEVDVNHINCTAEVDCHSMPPWTCASLGWDMAEAAVWDNGDGDGVRSTNTKSSLSLPSTPTKRPDNGGGSHGKQMSQTHSIPTKNKSIAKNRRPSAKTNKSGQVKRKSGKAPAHRQLLSNQRKLTEFFSV